MLFMRALLLLLLLLLLCVTERKSLKTDVVSSTGQNTKKRGPRERVSSSQSRAVFLFDTFFLFFFGFLICLTLFLYSSFSTRRGY